MYCLCAMLDLVFRILTGRQLSILRYSKNIVFAVILIFDQWLKTIRSKLAYVCHNFYVDLASENLPILRLLKELISKASEENVNQNEAITSHRALLQCVFLKRKRGKFAFNFTNFTASNQIHIRFDKRL